MLIIVFSFSMWLTGEAINDPGFAYPGQITGTPTSTPFVSGFVSTVPISVVGIQVGSMPGTAIYAQLHGHSFQIVSDVYVGYINPSEPNQAYVVRTGYPAALVDYSYATGGGQVVLLDSTQIAAYAAQTLRLQSIIRQLVGALLTIIVGSFIMAAAYVLINPQSYAHNFGNSFHQQIEEGLSVANCLIIWLSAMGAFKRRRALYILTPHLASLEGKKYDAARSGNRGTSDAFLHRLALSFLQHSVD